jgi:hypothetical protein
MSNSDKDINKRVEKAVKDILADRKVEDPFNVVEKARKYQVSC